MKLLETWYKCTGGSFDEIGFAKFFLCNKHVLYRPESQFRARALLFFYRGLYFYKRNRYNVDTWEARVFGVDKSSAKIWYCVLPACVFYRPERNLFKGIPVIGLLVGLILPKISGFSYNQHRKRSDR